MSNADGMAFAGTSAPDLVVGRERAVAAIERFLGGLTAPRMLIVTGRPGIGKTTMLEVARSRAVGRGWTVLSCRPDQAEVALAFGGLVDLFADVPSERFASLPPAQRTDLDIALRRRPPDAGLPDPLAVSAGARGAVGILAAAGPVVLVIDDAHWLDPSTAAILAYILRRLRSEPVGVILARRDEPPLDGGGADPLAALERFSEIATERLALEPLSLSSMHHIIRARTGEVLPRPLLHRVTDASGGNPFLAIELVRSMLEDGGRPDTDDPLRAPAGLLEHTAQRLARLTPEARRVLLVAASASPATEALIASVVERDPGPALDAARTAGILAAGPGPLRFTHPLYAECLVRLAGDEERREVHRRIAALVDEPEGRARHLARSADPPDASIAAALDAGAAAARSRGSLRAAAALLLDAMRFTPPDDQAGRDRRTFEAAGLAVLTGDRTRARTLLDGLVERTGAPLRPRAAALLAEIVASAGEVEAAQRILLDARETVTEPETTVRIDLDLAYTSLVRMAPLAAAGYATRAAEAARSVADPALLAEALAYAALSRLLAGLDPDEHAITRALELEDRGRPPYMGLPTSGVVGLVRAYAGDHDEARRLLAAAGADLDALGDDADLAHVLLWWSWVEMRSGRLDEAAGLARQAATMSETTGSELLRAWSVAQAAQVEAYRGLLDPARSLLAEATRGGDHRDGIVAVWVRATEMLAHLAAGDSGAAVAAIRPILEAARSEPLAEPVIGFFIPDAAEALAMVGDTETADAVLQPFEVAAHERGRAWAIASGLRGRAAIDVAAGRPDDAVERLRHALVCHDEADLPLERARALLALGRSERRVGERRAARTHLEEAAERFDRAGAHGWAANARAEIRRIPGQRVPSDGLTAGERRVAELSGAGRTNREVAAALFISPKTVEANLARVYRKLGIATRAELGAWLADRGGDDGAAT